MFRMGMREESKKNLLVTVLEFEMEYKLYDKFYHHIQQQQEQILMMNM